MSDSGGPYADLDPHSLHEERREWQEMVRNVQRGDDPESRRAWREEGYRRQEILDDINEEISYRARQTQIRG